LAGERADVVVCAPDRPLGAVVGGDQITLIDLENARDPALFEPLSVGDQDLVAAAFSPDGKTLVAIAAEGNQLIPIDVSDPARPRPGAPVELHPGERVPLARDLAYSPTGDAIWVVTGDNAIAVKAGHHPTRLVILSGEAAPVVQDTLTITGAPPPRALAVARRESIQGATAIRSRAKRAAIAIAGVDRALFALADPGAIRAQILIETTDLGHLVRTDLDGDSVVLYTERIVMDDVAMSHDARALFAPAFRIAGSPDAIQIEFGLTLTPIDGGDSQFIRLGDGDANAVDGPAAVALSP
jgi:hypothetical protein